MLLLLFTLMLGCDSGKVGGDTAGGDGGSVDGGSGDGGDSGGGDDGDGGLADEDNDGWPADAGDCDDNDASVNPDATDIPWDGIDQDCSGEDAGSLQSAVGLGELAIPDGGNISSTAIIGPCDTVYGTTVDIDISHTYIGDLVVTLVAPNGDSNALHVRGGGEEEDIVGSYSSEWGASLEAAVDLSKLNGTPGTGTWTLWIYDQDEDDVGTLNSWSLELRCP